jgi:hypothetical protein
MTPQALKALKQSIEHWRRIAAGTRKPKESVGVQHCALCRKFNPPEMPSGMTYNDRCGGCPVKERTGKHFCDGTPWVEIEDVIDSHSGEGATQMWLNTDKAKALAAEELAFLESLLPGSQK